LSLIKSSEILLKVVKKVRNKKIKQKIKGIKFRRIKKTKEAKMSVKKGDRVVVNYTGSFEDGTVFDSSYHGDHSHPIEFTVGSGEIIKGFDEAVIGMEVGEEKDITIMPEDGYGEKKEELIQRIPKSQFPDSEGIQEGMSVNLVTTEGQEFPATIVKIENEFITIDLNHPLAGEKLNFKIKLEGIK